MNRLLALIFGIAGGVIGFVINIINSATRFVGQIVGITDHGGHVIIGTLASNIHMHNSTHNLGHVIPRSR